jgi:predicted nucleic acid-binding protein
MIVLDTNVVSELMRAAPAARVVAWVHEQPAAEMCTTSVTLAEIRYGIARLPAGRRRDHLRATADDVFSAFAGQVLAFDATAATHYADIVVEREHCGSPISGFDAQIAAVCRAHRASLATRNTDDFGRLGLDLIDPWTDSPGPRNPA